MNPQPAASPAESAVSPDPHHRAMSTHLLARLAWAMRALSMAFMALGLLCLALSWSTPVPPAWGFRGFPAIFAVAFSTVGAVVASRRPDNRVGWIFCAAGLMT